VTSKQSVKPPIVVQGVDIRALPIGPEEAFVLSRVDGTSSWTDIAIATGLAEEQVEAALQRLSEIGAILYEGASAGAGQHAQTVVEMEAVQPSKPPPYDVRELDEEADLSLEKKKKILETFYLLEDLSHYELLGVPHDADKKSIKASYYQVVNMFHPDRYFGKKLGTFKAKMEAVFARITVAHDTLTRINPRREYDEYLQSQLKTRQFDDLMATEATVAAVMEAKPPVGAVRVEQTAQARVAMASSTDPRTAPPVSPSQPRMRTASDPEVRRRALARKLRTTSPRPSVSGTIPAVQASVDKETLKQQVVADLKSRYGSQLAQGTAQQVEHYVKAAEQAAKASDPVSAANSLRIASQLAPENQEIAKQLADAQAKAAAGLADHYLEQAQYEQREGRHLRAAQSYERAALGKNSASLYDRAAKCLVDGNGELKHAADLAKKAAQLAPDQADYHVTLSRVYAAAKMVTSAAAEAEKAVKLAPENQSAKEWLKRMKRGEF
jgi:curved DNA-binding protein CbpA